MGNTYCHPKKDKDVANDWTRKLCNCRDPKLCLCSYFCPCVMFGRNAAVFNEPCCCCGCLWFCICGAGCYAHMRIRGLIRKKYDIEGSWRKDCLFAYFCCPCALYQESQEIKLKSTIHSSNSSPSVITSQPSEIDEEEAQL